MLNGVLVLDADTELFPHKGAGSLAAKEVLGADRLARAAIHMLQLHLHGIIWVLGLVGGEALDGPRPLDFDAVLREIVEEDALDVALVEEGGEGVPGVDEARAACPGAGPLDTAAVIRRVPKGNFVDTGGLVGHER